MKIRKQHRMQLRRQANSVRQELPILPACEHYTAEVERIYQALEAAYLQGAAEAAQRIAILTSKEPK